MALVLKVRSTVSTTDRIIKKRGATLCDCISYIGSTTFVHVFVYCTHTGRQAGRQARSRAPILVLFLLYNYKINLEQKVAPSCILLPRLSVYCTPKFATLFKKNEYDINRDTTFFPTRIKFKIRILKNLN